RRRHTRFSRDWSSDVCSSDLIERSLSEWMNLILDLKDKTDSEKKEFVLNAWNNLPHNERFIFNKLLGGSFRVGVSSKGLINALRSEERRVGKECIFRL